MPKVVIVLKIKIGVWKQCNCFCLKRNDQVCFLVKTYEISLRRNYPVDGIKPNYMWHYLHSKYDYDSRRAGGSMVTAGVLTTGFLYKEFTKYEKLAYNEDYIRRKVKLCPESKIMKTVAVLERNWGWE